MDAKITLSFDNNDYKSLEELPISDWVNALAEGSAEYKKPPSRRKMKDEFFKAKK